jgi:hypothetical protein
MFTRAVLLLLTAVALAGAIPAQAARLAAAPTLFDVSPAHVYNNADGAITIIGVGFVATPVVTLSILDQKPILLKGAQLTSPTTLEATVPAGTPEGVYALHVYNPDGSRSAGTPPRLSVVRPGDGRMATWAGATPLDGSRTGFALVAAAGNLYVIGGFSGSGGWTGLRTVQRAVIAADGSLGAWQPASPMNRARGDLAAVVDGDHIYAIGGAMAAGIPTETGVERARINADGSLGPWASVGTLPEVRYRAGAVALDGYLIIMDGLAGWGGETPPPDTIKARINPDGSLGPWETAPATAGRSTRAATWGAFIYALNEDGSIERSALGSDGHLEPWVGVANTAVEHREGSVAVLDDTLLVVGGLGGSYPNQYPITNVERALLRPDGSLGSWAPAPSLLAGHGRFATTVWEENIYAAGDGSAIEGTRDVEFSRALELVLTERHHLPLLAAAR